MPKTQKTPITAAVRQLRALHIDFTPRHYGYVPKGGARASSRALDIDPHQVIKTLVMEDETRAPLIILMHGDCSVNTGELARQTGHKSVNPCAPKTAEKHSGYLVGGTSPFGMRIAMPLFVERSILALDSIYINGGKRGFLMQLAPQVLLDVLQATSVDVAQPLDYEA